MRHDPARDFDHPALSATTPCAVTFSTASSAPDRAGGTMTDRASRTRFVITILVGSFLLFLIQPMVARAALPRLGGAPNVWNSAMLVYQALLLGGYAYAHWLGGSRSAGRPRSISRCWRWPR
jgi:hypothetical protein